MMAGQRFQGAPAAAVACGIVDPIRGSNLYPGTCRSRAADLGQESHSKDDQDVAHAVDLSRILVLLL